jgi:hypothetical protein
MKSNLIYLEATRIIHTKLKGSKLLPTSKRKVKKQIAMVMEFFGVTEINAILLSSIIQESFIEGDVDLRQLANHYTIELPQAPLIFQAVEELSEGGYIYKDDRRPRSNRKVVPLAHVMDAVLKNDSKKLRPRIIAGLCDIFSEYNKLQSLRKRGSITPEQFVAQVVQVFSRSAHLPAIQYLQSLELSDEEWVMLMFMANMTFQGSETIEVGDAVKEITSDMGEYYDWCARFRTQDLTLFKEELIEFSFFEIGIDTDVSLTQVTRERLFASVQAPVMNYFKPKLSQLILPGNTAPIELIHDDTVARNMESIEHSLEKDHYNQLCVKLKERRLRGGFTILLHGHPGTGKTESVYQLARKTNRAVLRLEISQIKAMWVGESEKNLKKVFMEYKQAKRALQHHPILLFNEADAVFGKRRDVNTSVDQMENSLQNILLQELEEFDGILIATTNLTQNMDTAFDRRFLFKVEFSVPAVETRVKLLQSNFSHLNENDLKEIAARYEFTGSAIENIKRKLIISELLADSTIVDRILLNKLFSEESSMMDSIIGFRLA